MEILKENLVRGFAYETRIDKTVENKKGIVTMRDLRKVYKWTQENKIRFNGNV